MGFHAYRNIGFSFTDAETTCGKWRSKFSGFDADGKERYITFKKDGVHILLQYFGKSSPAIGFALPLENLMNALDRQNIPIEVNEEASYISYNDSNLKEAVLKAQNLRREGKKVKMIREEEA